MADELLDLVDEKDNVIGTVLKSKAHGDASLIHREVAIAVFNNKDEVLLQQRSLNKRNDPGLWKITAAGHVGAGEDPKNAVERELLEELGIKVNAIFYTKVFKREVGGNKIPEARHFWIYYAKIDTDQELKIDKDEVADAKWVKMKDLEDFSKNNDYSLTGLSHKIIMETYNKYIKK